MQRETAMLRIGVSFALEDLGADEVLDLDRPRELHGAASVRHERGRREGAEVDS